MITESATVIRCQGGYAEVQIERQSACNHCELESGCGTGAIGRLLGNRRKPLTIDTDQELHPGDQVVLGIPEAQLVRASMLVYGMPLLGMLIFGLTAHTLFESEEWLVVIFAIAGFVAGFKFASWLALSSSSFDIVDIRVNPERLSES